MLSLVYRFNNPNIDNEMMFDKEGVGDFQTFGVGYIFKIKNNWQFGAKGRIRLSSNFDSSSIAIILDIQLLFFL